MAGRWSGEQCQQLINLVATRPFLWLKKDPEYMNKPLRATAWQQIEAMMQTEAGESQQKFKSLRDEYARYIKGTRKGFHFANEMGFLRSEIIPRSSGAKRHRTMYDHSQYVRDDSDDVSDGLVEEVELETETENSRTQELGQNQLYSHCYLSLDGSQVVEEEEEKPIFVPEAPSVPQIVSPTPTNPSLLKPAPAPPSNLTSSVLTETTTTTEWTVPGDDFIISSEDYHFCNTILRTMNDLPKHRKRKLQVKIFQMVVDDVTDYEGNAVD